MLLPTGTSVASTSGLTAMTLGAGGRSWSFTALVRAAVAAHCESAPEQCRNTSGEHTHGHGGCVIDGGLHRLHHSRLARCAAPRKSSVPRSQSAIERQGPSEVVVQLPDKPERPLVRELAVRLTRTERRADELQLQVLQVLEPEDEVSSSPTSGLSQSSSASMRTSRISSAACCWR